MKFNRIAFLTVSALMLMSCNIDARPNIGAGWDAGAKQDVRISSLDSLTVESLRKREFGSKIRIETDLSKSVKAQKYASAFFVKSKKSYESFLASYDSDGLRLYTRIDVPSTPMPERGYPIVVFAHGYVGYKDALDFHFSYTPESIYAEMIDAYAKAGFVVLTPGYRGHGTVDGIVADGRESMAAWDNATYVSPIYYAIDVLNLIDGLDSLKDIDWQQWGARKGGVRFDSKLLSLAAHSQGGDVALISLAVSSKGSLVKNRIKSASIMAGTFPGRFKQLETYDAMASSPEAFLAGDGSWTGTATGKDGKINANFVFAWPPDSIETPDPSAWTWQKDTWSQLSVAAVNRSRYEKMYDRLRKQVDDLSDVQLQTSTDSPEENGLRHDLRVAGIMGRLGAFHLPDLIKAKLSLHFSDRDFYSIPKWNYDLCARINAAAGKCSAFEYVGNTHGMRVSKQQWFSPPGAVEAYDIVIHRDLKLFGEISNNGAE